jgi:hypothetical protein
MRQKISTLIPIQITQAEVESVAIDYSDTEYVPTIEVKVSLRDVWGKRITSISLGSRSWYSDKLSITPEIVELFGKIRRELDIAVTLHMNKQNKQLEAST